MASLNAAHVLGALGRKARLFGRGDPSATPPRARGSVTYLAALDPGSAQRLKNYTSYLGAVTIPDVYKCISVISNTFSATSLRILGDDDEERDVKTRLPALHALLSRPNPEMRGRHFRQTLSHHYQLCGNAIVLKDNYDGLGRPTELWPLRPDRVHILRSEVGKLAYGYDAADGAATKGTGTGQTRTQWYDGADILHVRWAHPLDSLWGLGVIEAGEQAFSRSRLVNEFALNFFSRGGIVDGVLTTPQEIPEEDRRALVSDWRAMREGARNKLRTALLWAGASYQPIQEPLGRVPVMDLTRMSLVDIAQLFGVPLQLLGDFSESNYRNAQEAVQFFYGETLGPQCDQFTEDFWTPLLQDFDPSLRAEYEQREVIDYQMRADAAAKLAGTGAFAVNDLRVAAGYDPLPEDDELGAMIPLPKGMTLLSPQQALALGDEVHEAPEQMPPAPQVTELDQATGDRRQATEQGQAAGQETEQPPGGPQVPAEQPAAKSVPRAMRADKTYPAALLSPQKRDEQRRRSLAGRAGAPSAEPSAGSSPLFLLPAGGRKAHVQAQAHAEQDPPDAGSALRSGADADPARRPPPSAGSSRGHVAAPRTRSRPAAAAETRAVAARPQAGEQERIRRASLDWSPQDARVDEEAWPQVAGSAGPSASSSADADADTGADGDGAP